MNKKRLTEGDWMKGGEYTFKHKVRLFFGIHGQMHDGRYCFDIPKWGSLKTQKSMHKFMFYVGNPFLNKLIGYDRL